MSRLSLNIGAAEGDQTGDHARVGGNKINLNFAELYAFLGGDTLTQTAGSVLLGNGTGALSSFASTAGRLVIGNGSSGLTDDANLTWDATNHRLGIGTAPQYTLEVVGQTTLRDGDAYTWSGGSIPSSALIRMGTDSNGNGLIIHGGDTNPLSGVYFGIYNRFGTQLLNLTSDGLSLSGRMGNSSGFFGGGFLNLNSVVSRNVFSDNNDVNNPAMAVWDQRSSLTTERTFPLMWWGGGSQSPLITQMTGGMNAIDDGTRKGAAFYSYTGSTLKENFRILDDQTLRLPNGAAIWNNGLQVLGARDTGWTAQTAAASKADLGATPTVGAIASWAAAIQAALTTHGILGA